MTELQPNLCTVPKHIADMSEIILPIEDSIIDGMYLRTMYAPSGAFIIGAEHLKDGVAILSKGTIRVIDGDEKYEITAPYIYQTKKGSQKFGLAIGEVEFTTIHAVEAKTTIDAEVELFADVPQITRIRNSYKTLLNKLDITEYEVHAFMNSHEVVDEVSENYFLAESAINGVGCFTKRDITKGDCIAISVIDDQRLPTSRFINHSDNPNAQFIPYEDSLALIAIKNISTKNEIFVNYEERLKLCQPQ